MSFKEIPGRYDGPKLEEEILEFWRKESIFEKSLLQSEGMPRFSFNEGPPTANGKPGIHHVLARTFKDIYPRYKTMRGFYAPRKGGWDTHGLPVEHEIEKRLGIFDKKEIEEKVGIAEFTRRCRESVMTYISDWEKMTERMGYWVNLQEAYYTLDNDYIESVWHLIRQIWDKDLIYRGYKVVPYDPRIGATLSSHEVAQGYREVEDPSITVRFRLGSDPNTSFLVWTTTPWTLPSNLLLAVNSDVDYAWVRHREEVLILAKDRVEAVFANDDFKVIKTAQGSELIGTEYQRLFDDLDVNSDNCFRVTNADFVSTEDGTGIVHIAPAYGVDDLNLGQREGVPVLHCVGLDGHFKPEVELVAGLFFKDADQPIIEDLTKRGLMFHAGKEMHNYPFGWRTGDPLIYYAKNAWYIRTTQIKDRMVELNQQINWVPKTIKDGRFGNWLENNIDWALSRERFWGTPLPVWSNGEDYICIGSIAELEMLSGRSLKEIDLHRPQIDEITFNIEGREYRRVPEVIDCWFDSGSMPYAQWHYPFENEDIYKQHAPADYICEAIDQTRGWFYTLHAISALVSDQVSYKNCICLSHIVDQYGKKMSKSQGNIVNPYDVFDSVGVDSLRWLFLARLAPEVQKRISVDIVREVTASFVNTLWNTYAFFILYARIDQVDLGHQVDHQARPEIDRWILALTHQTIGIVTAALDQYDAKTAGEAIEKLIDQLSNWYVRRNRRRFWKSEAGIDKQSAYQTLHQSLDIVHRLIAPFMPFLSEAIYQNLVLGVYPDAKQSVHLTTWPKVDESLLDDQLVMEMDVVQQVVGCGRSARENSKVRVKQPLSRLLLKIDDNASITAVDKHQQQILEELNVKTLEFISDGDQLISYQVRPNFPRLGKRYGKLMPAIKQAIANADAAQLAAKVSEGEHFKLQVDSESLELEGEDVSITTVSAEGYASVECGGMLVALDTQLNAELIQEGLARELVRSVQDARKQAGLDVSDRIHLGINGSEAVNKALELYRDYIMAETLAVELSDVNEMGGYKNERSLSGESWTISIERV